MLSPDPGPNVEDRTVQVLNYAHRLLVATQGGSLPELLTELAQACRAECAGLTVPCDGPEHLRQIGWAQPAQHPCLLYPWETDGGVLGQLKKSATGQLVHERHGASWLLTAVKQASGTDWLLWVMVRGRVPTWSQGERAGLILVGQTLSRLASEGSAPWARPLEILRVQSSAEQAVRIAGHLAHDFGNCLTGILGFTELAVSQVPKDSLPHRYLMEVMESAQHGTGWVRKLQALGRRKPQVFVPAAVAPLVEEQAERVRTTWEKVTFAATVDPALPPVNADAEAMRQVLSHLVENACEAIVGQGAVTVSARTVCLGQEECQRLFGNSRPGSFVEITVADTGIGMSAEVRRRLLADAFFSTKPRHRGLGLLTVYWIVQAHQGGLEFGPHPERGTAVRVVFPVAPVPASVEAKLASTSVLADPFRPHILVVDDDPVVLKSICRNLDKAGYCAQGAPTGADALAHFQAPGAAFNLVISDIAMPEMHGFELTRQLLALDGRLNVLYISSLGPEHQEADSPLIHRFGLLRKPFGAQTLVKAVQTAMARRPLAVDTPAIT